MPQRPGIRENARIVQIVHLTAGPASASHKLMISCLQCDLGKPICERCRKSGRECAGYKHAPVFVCLEQLRPFLYQSNNHRLSIQRTA